MYFKHKLIETFSFLAAFCYYATEFYAFNRFGISTYFNFGKSRNTSVIP